MFVSDLCPMLIQFKNTYLERIFEGRPVTGKPRYSSDEIITIHDLTNHYQ